MPSFTARPLEFTAPDGYYPSNPSVARLGKEIVLLLHAVNFAVAEDSADLSPNDVPIHTRRFLLRLGSDLAIRSTSEIVVPANALSPSQLEAKCVDDARLFVWRDRLWCIACAGELRPAGLCDQVLARIDDSSLTSCLLVDGRVLRPEGPRQNRMNCIPRVVGEALQFIHFCDSTRVLDENACTIAEATPAVAVDRFCGGTQAIAFLGGWLALVYEVNERDSRCYHQHRFIWLDSMNRLRRVSLPFFFIRNGIESAAGLAPHSNGKSLLISFEVGRGQAWLATVEADEVQTILLDAEQLPFGMPTVGKDVKRGHAELRTARECDGVAVDVKDNSVAADQRQKYGWVNTDPVVATLTRYNDTQEPIIANSATGEMNRQRPVIDVVRAIGLGDVLMCTPALRALKRAKPGMRIRFYTDWGDVVAGLPYVDEVLPTAAAPADAIGLGYEHAVPPYAHISCVIGDRLGVNVRDVRPDCVMQLSLVEQFRTEWRKMPRPHVIVSRRASRWTPNKDWPEAYWVELIDQLARSSTVIEIGDSDVGVSSVPSRNYINLVGRMPLAEFVAAIGAADIHVGPVSAPVHVAAAARKPSVVICGGYEHPRGTMYPGNVVFYTPTFCAPCWIRDPCPYNRECLDRISPGLVEDAVWRIWSGVDASTGKIT